MVSAVPVAMPYTVAWVPDGNALLVNDRNGALSRYSVHGSPPRLLVDGVRLAADPVRPPDGADLLYERVAERASLYVMARDGSRARALVGPNGGICSCTLAGPARWSPDGADAFAIRINGDESRIFVMAADGSRLRRLTDEPGAWMEDDPVWSPHGDRIAFNRWQRDGTGDWQVRPIGDRDRRWRPRRVGGGRTGRGWRADRLVAGRPEYPVASGRP